MKPILLFSILLCAIAMPAIGELTDADLDKIRLIVNEEVKKESTITNAKIDGLDTRLRTVETDVAWTRGKLDSLDKHINWLMALIVVAVGLPQVIIAWRSRKDRTLEKQIETLTQEIETIKQQRIVSP
ncbi:MAG: hypothetical protein OXI63_26195 [Candidatus Poribacteria bacterium]|nr:hypothetical protein [Candidatus Poribacteria bacterium]